MKSAFFITAILTKKCIKSLIEGMPCILSFGTGQDLIDLASFRAMRDAYWKLFAEDGDARDGGQDILSLDRHGASAGVHGKPSNGF